MSLCFGGRAARSGSGCRVLPRPLFVGSVHPCQFFDRDLTLGNGEPSVRYQAKWRRPTTRQRPSFLLRFTRRFPFRRTVCIRATGLIHQAEPSSIAIRHIVQQQPGHQEHRKKHGAEDCKTRDRPIEAPLLVDPAVVVGGDRVRLGQRANERRCCVHRREMIGRGLPLIHIQAACIRKQRWFVRDIAELHVVGLRPFQSQLLCEQVVGRALRRRFYNINEDGKFDEEVALVFGVPFELVPFKATGATPKPRPPQRRIYAVPQKAQFAITVPRVLGYSIGIRNRIAVDWPTAARLVLDPSAIPPQSDLAAMLNQGRPSALSPGGLIRVDLAAFHRGNREQQLCFQMAADLTRHYVQQQGCEAPVHALFPQVLAIVQRYIAEKVVPSPPAERVDATGTICWPSMCESSARGSTRWPHRPCSTPEHFGQPGADQPGIERSDMRSAR